MKNEKTPRLLEKDIYRFMSQQSTLTQKQIEECFKTYARLLNSLIMSEDRMDDLIVCLPKLGNIKFNKIKGRKKGTSYKIPTYYGSKELKTIVLEEDEPDFDRLKMVFYGRFQNKAKDTSLNKIIKSNSFNFNFKEK